jgi:hypothetical protein
MPTIPLAKGNQWKFSFTNTSRMVTQYPTYFTDTGTVQWTVTENKVIITEPGQYAIRIEQVRTTVRRYGATGGVAYDSLYDPPRVVKEEISLTGCPDSNGISFSGSPFWSFVHDPQGVIPDSMLDIRDTMVPPGRELIAASVIDPAPARSKIPSIVPWGPDYFITAAGIGPVGYFRGSSPYLAGGSFAERWRLLEYSLVNTAVKEPRTPRLVLPARAGLPSDLLFDPRGRVVGRVDRQLSGGAAIQRATGLYFRSSANDPKNRVQKQIQVR